jgi:hypothetical protein
LLRPNADAAVNIAHSRKFTSWDGMIRSSWASFRAYWLKIANLAMVVDDKDVRSTLHPINIERPLRNVCRIMAAASFDKLCHKKPGS